MRIFMVCFFLFFSFPKRKKQNAKKLGFRFFAVDRTTYLTLQYLSNRITSEFPTMHSMCVMYNGKLIWSGLSQTDMRVLYTNNQEPNNMYMYSFMQKFTLKSSANIRGKHKLRHANSSKLSLHLSDSPSFCFFVNSALYKPIIFCTS